MTIQRIIVSRHPAATQFILENAPEFEGAPVMATATAKDIRGKDVAGNLPLHLAAEAEKVYAVEFDGEAPRGQEYGLEEMLVAGARLACYSVEKREDIRRCVCGSKYPLFKCPGGIANPGSESPCEFCG